MPVVLLTSDIPYPIDSVKCEIACHICVLLSLHSHCQYFLPGLLLPAPAMAVASHLLCLFQPTVCFLSFLFCVLPINHIYILLIDWLIDWFVAHLSLYYSPAQISLLAFKALFLAFGSSLTYQINFSLLYDFSCKENNLVFPDMLQ